METATALARWIAMARSSRRTRFFPSCCGTTAGGTRSVFRGCGPKTLRRSQDVLDKIAEKFGRKIFETPIGFKYICELMLERDILLGGEESGGIGTKLYLPERDATVMALLLVEVMAWQKKSLGELVAMLQAEFGEHHYGRVDLELRPGQKERAIEHFSGAKVKSMLDWGVARREDLDGIKLYLDDLGWVMLRASGTEPMLRVYSETRSPAATRKILEHACAVGSGAPAVGLVSSVGFCGACFSLRKVSLA